LNSSFVPGEIKPKKAIKSRLRVVRVEFTPTPGAEQRLKRIYDILLTDKIKDGAASDEREPMFRRRGGIKRI